MEFSADHKLYFISGPCLKEVSQSARYGWPDLTASKNMNVSIHQYNITALGPFERYCLVFIWLGYVALTGQFRNMYELSLANCVLLPYVLLSVNTACFILKYSFIKLNLNAYSLRVDLLNNSFRNRFLHNSYRQKY